MKNKIVNVQDINDSNTINFGEIITDGFFATKVAEGMKKDDESMTDDVVNNVFLNASSILNQCPNPNCKNEFKKTGIVIGKVQSGKTSNFIALLALAFDNGYNLAVVIGGNTTELLTQNVNRIKKSFNVGVDKLKVLHSKDNHNEITPEKIKGFIDNGNKVLIVTLKSPQAKTQKHMTRVSQLFDDPTLANETTIIIDDEGDQATLNAKAYSTEAELDKRVSQTYKVAIDIKEKIKRHCFISITATPQANLLIKTSDKLSPDFGQLIEPGKGYCGLSVFHGDEQDKYVKVIPDDEDTLLDSEGGIPNSFYQAISAFYVSNAIRLSRGDNGIHSMLIHPSVKKFDHAMVQKKVDQLLSEWRKIIKLGKDDVSYIYTLKPYLQEAYNMYSKETSLSKSFDELEDTILNCIKTSSDSLVFNSDQINSSSTADLYTTRIYLGGTILDRGITIKGLTITYIIRRAKGYQNVDNTEQRARWFGYKNVPYYSDYIDVCRIWATQSIKDDFASINESDEEMRTSIQRNLKNGIKFKDLPRIFLLQHDASHKLRLTRPNVARTQELMSWTEWKRQDYFNDVKAEADMNFKLLEDYRKSLKGIVKDHGGVNKNFYAYDIEFDDFINQVLKYYNFKNDDTFSKELFNTFLSVIETKKQDTKIDLCWVRYNWMNEERSINDDLTFKPPFYRGRDTDKNANGGYDYYGDRSTCDARPTKIQIQIHYLKAKNRPDLDFISPAICIYIPENYAIRLVGAEK